MTLLQSWANSLALFLPKNFKPFVQVTLLNIGRIYRLFWPYFIAYAIVSTLFSLLLLHALTVTPSETIVTMASIIGVLALIAPVFHYSIFCLAARPSAERKTLHYFVWYLTSAWRLVIAWMLLIVTTGLVHSATQLLIVDGIPMNVPTLPLFILMFFYFDGRKTMRGLLRAIKRSITMLIWNAPLFLTLRLLYAVLAAILLRVSVLAPPVAYIPWQLLVIEPVLFALLSTIYTTRIHGQPSLYVRETN